jgi:hypothetical protein
MEKLRNFLALLSQLREKNYRRQSSKRLKDK